MTRVIRRDESGAAVVEAAMVTSLVFFSLLLIFQAALFGRAYIGASDASTAGARAGSVAATDPIADFDILQATKRAMSGGQRSDVQAIVVFRAVAPNFDMPAACATGPTADCNYYVASDMNRPSTDFGDGGWGADDFFKPADRLAAGSNERIGVYVKLKIAGMAGPLPSTVSRSFIASLEPR